MLNDDLISTAVIYYNN